MDIHVGAPRHLLPFCAMWGYHIQNGSGAHPASYPVGTRGSFFGGKVAGA